MRRPLQLIAILLATASLAGCTAAGQNTSAGNFKGDEKEVEMHTQPDEEAIRALAHKLWEQRGRPLGSPEVDWQEAERLLRAQQPASQPTSKAVDESIKQSFPASDAPGSHLPDEPPVNAEAKWAAAGLDREKLSRGAGRERGRRCQIWSRTRMTPRPCRGTAIHERLRFDVLALGPSHERQREADLPELRAP